MRKAELSFRFRIARKWFEVGGNFQARMKFSLPVRTWEEGRSCTGAN